MVNNNIFVTPSSGTIYVGINNYKIDKEFEITDDSGVDSEVVTELEQKVEDLTNELEELEYIREQDEKIKAENAELLAENVAVKQENATVINNNNVVVNNNLDLTTNNNRLATAFNNFLEGKEYRDIEAGDVTLNSFSNLDFSLNSMYVYSDKLAEFNDKLLANIANISFEGSVNNPIFYCASYKKLPKLDFSKVTYINKPFYNLLVTEQKEVDLDMSNANYVDFTMDCFPNCEKYNIVIKNDPNRQIGMIIGNNNGYRYIKQSNPNIDEVPVKELTISTIDNKPLTDANRSFTIELQLLFDSRKVLEDFVDSLPDATKVSYSNRPYLWFYRTNEGNNYNIFYNDNYVETMRNKLSNKGYSCVTN